MWHTRCVKLFWVRLGPSLVQANFMSIVWQQKHCAWGLAQASCSPATSPMEYVGTWFLAEVSATNSLHFWLGYWHLPF